MGPNPSPSFGLSLRFATWGRVLPTLPDIPVFWLGKRSFLPHVVGPPELHDS